MTRWSTKRTVRPAEITDAELEACWEDLTISAEKAYRAMGKMLAAPERAVAFLGGRVKQALAAEAKQVATLIADLGSEQFKVREKASDDLLKFGSAALPQLQHALADKDEEIHERAREGIAALDGKTNPELTAAVVRVLRVKAPAETVKTLLDFLPNAENDTVADEVFMTLALLGVKENKVDAVLAEALKDKQAPRRAAAALVLGRSGTAEQRRQVSEVERGLGVRPFEGAAQSDQGVLQNVVGLLPALHDWELPQHLPRQPTEALAGVLD